MDSTESRDSRDNNRKTVGLCLGLGAGLNSASSGQPWTSSFTLTLLWTLTGLWKTSRTESPPQLDTGHWTLDTGHWTPPVPWDYYLHKPAVDIFH